MNDKRITILCGHYGSGKTNIAVNLAMSLKERYDKVSIADLDIVNPYFRTKDSSKQLADAGIQLICSEYAGSNLDIPALPAQMYSLTDDKTARAVLDIGGDDRGALALGRLTPQILAENDYDMLAVINCYRPLTRDAQSTVQILREIEFAAGIAFTGIINNSNLGRETTPEDVLNSLAYAQETAKLMNIPVICTCAEEHICGKLKGNVENLIPLKLQEKID